jgi:hypothetical protein
MKPTRRRPSAAIFEAKWQLYRSLCEERAKIVARLRQIENQEMADYIQPTIPITAEILAGRKMTTD